MPQQVGSVRRRADRGLEQKRIGILTTLTYLSHPIIARAHRSWFPWWTSIACNLPHQKMHVYGVPHLNHLAVFQAIHGRSRILDTSARRGHAGKLSRVRATVGDPG